MNIREAVTFVTTNCFFNAQAICDRVPYPFFSCSLRAARELLVSRPQSEVVMYWRLLAPMLQGHAWILAWEVERQEWMLIQSFHGCEALQVHTLDESQLTRLAHAIRMVERALEANKGLSSPLEQLMSALDLHGRLGRFENYTLNVWVARKRSSWGWKTLALFFQEGHKPVTLLTLLGVLCFMMGWWSRN